jgi:hypothetical protein
MSCIIDVLGEDQAENHGAGPRGDTQEDDVGCRISYIERYIVVYRQAYRFKASCLARPSSVSRSNGLRSNLMTQCLADSMPSSGLTA